MHFWANRGPKATFRRFIPILYIGRLVRQAAPEKGEARITTAAGRSKKEPTGRSSRRKSLRRLAPHEGHEQAMPLGPSAVEWGFRSVCRSRVGNSCGRSPYFFSTFFGKAKNLYYLCAPIRQKSYQMVDVAQSVRALDCGSRCRGFESHLPPGKPKRTTVVDRRFFYCHPAVQPWSRAGC